MPNWFYILLWLAIIFTSLLILSIVAYCCDTLTDTFLYTNVFFAMFAISCWLAIPIAWLILSPKDKYQDLLYDKVKAERKIEKYLIDHPELREFEIDENGCIIKAGE